MVYVKLVLMALFWGGTFIATKQVVQEVDAITGAFLRFFVASFFLLLILSLRKGGLPKLSFKQFIGIFCLAVTGVVLYNIAFFEGLRYIEASRASVIIAMNPIFIAGLSSLFFKESMNTKKVIGIVVSVVGAMMIVTKGNFSSIFSHGLGTGEMFILVCVFSWVAYSLIGKHLLQNLSPMITTCYASIVGMFILFVLSCYEGGISNVITLSLSAWIGIAYLGIFGTVLGFVWYYDGIKKIGASKSGLFINIVPVSAVILGHFLLGEPLTNILIAGMILVIIGVLLVTVQRRK